MSDTRGLRWSVVLCLMVFHLFGCEEPWNAPRPIAEYAENTLFSSFSGKSPKTLDPQVSYSSDETIYTYNVYEPPFAYHYLKRPYEIVPRTAERLPEVTYLDVTGRVLPVDAAPQSIALSRYRITIRPGIQFAPHPAFAKDVAGTYRYHRMPEGQAEHLESPLDLPERGTRELTAEDYVYAIKRIANPRNVSPILPVMAERIVGLSELAQRLVNRDVRERETKKLSPWLDLRSESLSGVRSVDRYTFEIDIKGKYPQFVNWLTMCFFAPMPWEAEAFYANPGFARHNISLATWPVGTGPFYLAKSRTNREHVLEKNPNYRFDSYPCEGEVGDRKKGLFADCGKPLPRVDRIVMTLEKEAIPTTSKFLQGYYDSPQIARTDTGIGYLVAASDYADKAKLYRERRLQFPQSVEANNWYIGFNWLDPILGGGNTPEEALRHRKLRQAISIAIDWEEQIAIFEKGQGSPAHGPLPPGLFGWRLDGPAAFNPVVYRKDADGRIYRRPIEDAKRLLEEAGYPDGRDKKTGKPLVLNFDWQGTAAGSKAFLDWFSRQFAKLGIQLEIRATDYNRFQDKMNRGAAQIYYWGWLADYPDAENFLFLLYGPNSKAGLHGGGENASNYRNPEYDALFEAMKFEEDGPRKSELIDRMIRIVQEDAPWSFGYNPTAASALHHWVRNAKPSQMVRDTIRYYGVDTKERVASIEAWNRPVLWPGALLLLALCGIGLFVYQHVGRKNTGRRMRP